jgi:hypothetical protein
VIMDTLRGWERRSIAREAERRKARPRKKPTQPRERKPCPWCVKMGRADNVQTIWLESRACRSCSVVMRSLQKPAKTRLEPYRNGEDFRFEARVAQLARLRQEMPL